MVTFLAALLCIILGFGVAIFKGDLLFAPVVWFVAAIAINTLSVVLPAFGPKKAAP